MKWFWYILAVIVLVFALGLFFQVNSIDTEGNTRYGTEEIIAASELELGGSLFVFDKADAEARILESFPYVDEVDIKPKLPDKLLISITESVPLAKIELNDGTFILLDRSGKVLDIGDTTVEGVEIRGVYVTDCSPGEVYPTDSDSEAEALDYALEVLDEIRLAELTDGVTYIQVSVLNPIFDYAGKYKVEVGKRESTSDKIATLKRTLPQLENGYYATIDLSVLREAHYIPN
ncbi:MAG: FtsQ-type POTRA domain-containing protein [Oscillospiraceae bacterium]|nr:FtsQ-type POTRA domain-containing protein [Oscillospiraceae bacterium]